MIVVNKHTNTPFGLESIELGLPSGTKWANMNIGASTQEEFGHHFAWGELNEKDNYTWDTYVHYDKSNGLCQNIGICISGTNYDVAHVKWGGAWQIPTMEQVEELLKCCESIKFSMDGIDGCRFIGPNGNYIFLPAAGDRYGMGAGTRSSFGYYWSGTPNPIRTAYDNYGAYGIDLWKFNPVCNINNRNVGCSIRPVENRY